jgi:hypothetical protein
MSDTVWIAGGLVISGLPLSYILLGVRAETLFVAPIVTAVAAAVAAILELTVGGNPLLLWLAVLTLSTVTGAIVRAKVARPTHQPLATAAALTALMALAVARPLQTLRTTFVDWDGRSIWFLHARWLVVGGGTYLRNAHSAPLQFAHNDYPPLAAEVVAVSWKIAAHVDLRMAQVLVAELTAAATILAGLALMRSIPGSRKLAAAAGAVLAACLYGVWGDFAFNGFMDPLAAALGLSALLFGVLAPRNRENFILGLVCALACAWTKNEGLVLAMILFAAMAARSVIALPSWSLRRAVRSPHLRAIAATTGVALLWAFTVRARGIRSDLTGTAAGRQPVHRFVVLAGPLRGHLELLLIALILSALVVIWAPPGRERTHLLIAWVATLGDLAAVIAVYVFGPQEIHWWITTSLDRTMMFFRATALALIVMAATKAAATAPVDTVRGLWVSWYSFGNYDLEEDLEEVAAAGR